MHYCAVIADDLTGANATGVLMCKLGLECYTVMNKSQLSSNINCDSVIFSTDSRSINPQAAYERVYEATSTLKDPRIKVYSKRIDSTLRGNLGKETDAMLDAVGGGAVAMVVPCFPSSGRIIIGGYLLVAGLPVHRTEAAVDPKTPVHTSDCAELFRRQSKYPVANIYLEEQMGGEATIAKKIQKLAAQGARTIVFDAVTQEDIEQIADAIIQSKVPFIAVDPGVFTATIARKLVDTAKTRHSSKVLAVVGSVNAVASRQVEIFLASQNVLNVYMDVAEFLEDEVRCKAEIARVVQEITENCEDFEVCSIIGNGVNPAFRLPFDQYAKRYGRSFDELSNQINDAIAAIAYQIIAKQKAFRGIYSCGGDITVAICKQMKNVGLRLISEVLPLAAYGELAGGDCDGLKIVTKGGMVGNTDAMVACVGYLKEKLSI